MKYLVYIFYFAFIFSCNSKEKNENIEENVAGKKVYDMYQPSEMATLMNEMYAENLKIKNEILAGNTPEVFPTDFLKINTAQLSDFKKRNAKFKALSARTKKASSGQRSTGARPDARRGRTQGARRLHSSVRKRDRIRNTKPGVKGQGSNNNIRL